MQQITKENTTKAFLQPNTQFFTGIIKNILAVKSTGGCLLYQCEYRSPGKRRQKDASKSY